jgi:hypothetical protein
VGSGVAFGGSGVGSGVAFGGSGIGSGVAFGGGAVGSGAAAAGGVGGEAATPSSAADVSISEDNNVNAKKTAKARRSLLFMESSRSGF